MPKLTLHILREIQLFCRQLPPTPFFFFLDHAYCSSTRELSKSSYNIPMELLTGERLKLFQDNGGRLLKTLVFYIPQLNEFVKLMRDINIDTWDDAKDQWFQREVLPHLYCPVSKELMTHPIVRLTVGLPDRMFPDTYDVRLGHLFEKETYLISNRNPYDALNPFFSRGALLPDNWNTLLTHIREACAMLIEAEEIPDHLPQATQNTPVAITHQPAPTDLHLINERENTYWFVKYAWELGRMASAYLIMVSQYRRRIGQFPADLASSRELFGKNLQDFLTRYPDCQLTLSNAAMQCAHSCADLFLNQWSFPAAGDERFKRLYGFSPLSRRTDPTFSNHYGVMACLAFVHLILCHANIQMDLVTLEEGPFSQFNSWMAALKNKSYLVTDFVGFCFNSMFLVVAHVLGDVSGEYDSKMHAYECSFPESFHACGKVPPCHELEPSSSTTWQTLCLLQAGFFAGSLLIPKVTCWVYDGMPIVAPIKRLISGVSRFFYHATPHDDHPTSTPERRVPEPVNRPNG